jgi:hypothetical protein
MAFRMKRLASTEIGAPMLKLSISATCGAIFSQRSAKLLGRLARWAPVKVLHGPLNAVVAAATAESTSREDASSTWPTREPVLGE